MRKEKDLDIVVGTPLHETYLIKFKFEKLCEV